MLVVFKEIISYFSYISKSKAERFCLFRKRASVTLTATNRLTHIVMSIATVLRKWLGKARKQYITY